MVINCSELLKSNHFVTLPNTGIVAVNGWYTVSYTFLNSANLYTTSYGSEISYYSNFSPLTHANTSFSEATSAQQAAIKKILKEPSVPVDAYSAFFSDVANISFDLLSTNGAIAIGQANANFYTQQGITPPSALSYLYNSAQTSEAVYGDIWIRSDDLDKNWAAFSSGSLEFYILLHELAHSLGLVHPTTLDDQKYTVMSYNQYEGMEGLYSAGLQIADISAIQSIYGRNYFKRSGDDVYTAGAGFGDTIFSDPEPFIYSIWDGGGVDTIDASPYEDGVDIDLRQGMFSSVGKSVDIYFLSSRGIGLAKDNLSIAYHSVIENATGTYDDDTLVGNLWENVLIGGAGEDKLYGEGFVYDGNDGYTSIDVNDLNDPNRNKPELAKDNDTLIAGAGKDTVYGGFGDDYIAGSANVKGNDLDGDYYHGGGYAGGSGFLNDEIERATDGFDTVDYGSISGFGVFARYESEGDWEVRKNSGFSLLPKKDTLKSIEHVIGTYQNDKFLITASNDSVLDGDPGMVRSLYFPSLVVGNVEIYQPDGSPYGHPFFTNMSWDTLDLSEIEEAVTVQRGGVTLSGVVPVTIAGNSPEDIVVTFLDEREMTTRGMEEVKLGKGDDLLIVGRFIISQGSESLYTEFDMGEGTDTVQVWGDAILKNGKIYTQDGAVVSGFEKIEISKYTGLFIDHQRTLLTEELGHEYVVNNDTVNWLDYSRIDEALTFSLSDASGGAVGATKTDAYSGRLNIVGTDFGDTYYASNGYGRVVLGSGNDIVNISGPSGYNGYHSGGFFYSGGDDVFYGNGNYYTAAIDASDIELGNITISYANQSITESNQYYAVYQVDVVVDVGTLGSMTFVDALTWYRYAGADGVLFTGDDVNTDYNSRASVVFDGGGIKLSQEGVAQFGGSGYMQASYRHDFSISVVTGTSGDDRILSSTFDDAAVYAGDGNDDIVGGQGNDILYGEDGHDYIRGGAGNDIIYGGAGNDILSGDAGDDTLIGGAGDDVLIGGSGKDTFVIDGMDIVYDYRIEEGDFVDASALNSSNLTSYESDGFIVITDGTRSFRFMDLYERLQSENGLAKSLMIGLSGGSKTVQLYSDGSIADIRDGATSGNDILTGTSSDDIVFGFDGNDTLYGLAGDDVLIGGDGNDVLDGGDGNDTLDGGHGNDTYVHTEGFDVIRDAGGADTIEFGAGFELLDMTLERVDNDHLLISFSNNPAVLIEEFFITGFFIETLLFADSSTFDLSLYHDVFGTVGNDILNGLDNALMLEDRIFGYAGDDILSGGLGNDYLEGGTGSDIYHYSSGLDTIKDSGGSADKVSFASGFDLGDISFVRDHADMIIRFNGIDTVRVESQFTQSGMIEALVFDDNSTLDMSSVSIVTEGTSGDDILYGISYGAGFNHLVGAGGDDTIYGSHLEDTLEGGAGANRLYGGAGDDLYIIASSGNVINEDNGIDAVKFGAGFDPLDISFERSGADDLIILFEDTPIVTIKGQFTEGGKVELIEFDNFSTIDLGQISHVLNGTSGDDILHGVTIGGGENDTIDAGDGDDTIYAYNGNNIIVSGDGDDTVYGGNGDDLYIYTSGLDIYEDIGGNDVIVFGAGYDQGDIELSKNSNDLRISFNSVHVITIKNHFVSGQGVETLIFDDSSTFDLSGFINEIMGTSGNDTLTGTQGADHIYGLSGNDILWGYDGDDLLNGGAGNDALYGGQGDDTYVFDYGFSADVAGDRVVEGAVDGEDIIRFIGGIDPDEVFRWTDNSGNLWFQLATNPAANTLKADGAYSSSTGITTYVEKVEFDDETIWDISQGLHLKNNDTARALYGTAYTDILEGGTAADTLWGYGGDDTLIGKGGNDILRGGDGDDTYVFERDFSGTVVGDAIIEMLNGGLDTILFVGDIDPEEVYSWTDTSGYLWYQVGDIAPTNSLKIQGAYSAVTGINVGDYVERVAFNDETIWDLSAGLHLRNNNTGRTLYGTSYADTIQGGTANDVLRGFDGDDVYVFSRDFSVNSTVGDRVQEAAGGGEDVIRFIGSITSEEVFRWTDNSGNLWFQLATNPATNTLKTDGAYSSSTGITTYVEKVEFDDETVWDISQGLHLKNNDTARALYGTSYTDILEGGTAADTLWGYGGNDTLIGKGGNDTLRGGDGDDTYVFDYGFSLNATGDRIIETVSGGEDTIRFVGGIAPEEVYMWTDASGYLWLQLGTSPASNTLKTDGAYSSSTGITTYVEKVEFDDATVWDISQGLHLRNNDTGRQLYGTAYDDVIEGGAANDTLRGFGGGDILAGHGGNDALYGGGGADTFLFFVDDVGNGVDTLHDFSLSDGDAIDLSDVLSNYDPLVNALADFVQFTNSASHSQLKVDVDGAGTEHGWVHIATVNSHTNIDLNDWVTNGNLLVV